MGDGCGQSTNEASQDWRVVTEVREFCEHMVNGLTRQLTGVDVCWGETEFGFRYVQSRLSAQYHFEG